MSAPTLRCFGVALISASIVFTQSAPATSRAQYGSRAAESAPSSITGIVTDEKSSPVPGAVCEICEDSSWLKGRPEEGELRARVVTGADGSFAIARNGLGLCDYFLLNVTHAKFAAERIPIDLRRLDGPVKARLGVGTPVSGIVIDSTDSPVPDATVRIYRGSGSARDPIGELEIATATDSAGRFVASRVGNGGKTLRTSKAGFATAGTRLTIEPGTPTSEVRLSLGEGKSISGALRDSRTGSPIGSAVVRAFPDPPPPYVGPLFRALLVTRTRGDGTYSLEGADSRPYRVTVTASGYVGDDGKPRSWSERRVDAAPAIGVDFALRSASRIRGRVLDAETGQPVERFRVGLLPEPGTMFLPAYHHEYAPPESRDGSFEILDVSSAKPAWAFAVAPGYAGGRSGEIVVKEGEVTAGVEIRLIRGAAIHGRVLDPNRSPVPHAKIEIDSTDPLTTRLRKDRSFEQSYTPCASTDADGFFTIPNLLSGTYRLSITHPNFGPSIVAEIAVPASGQVRLDDVSLDWGAKVRGRVLLPDGRPDAKAAVGVSWVGEDNQRQGRSGSTDSDGRYEIAGLAPGKYEIAVISREGRSIMNPARDWRFDSRAPSNKPKSLLLEALEVAEFDL